MRKAPFENGAFVLEGIPRPVGRGLVFVLVDSRVGHRESKGEFRALRSASQGAALRTRKPFEKGLSESFNDWCGGLGVQSRGNVTSDAELFEYDPVFIRRDCLLMIAGGDGHVVVALTEHDH